MFDPIRSYDKPAVIINQLANGIATTDSVRRVLFDPAALSPVERESFVDRLKEQVGGNPVSDTVVDVLANPLVWLGIAATAAGGNAAARNLAGGRRFFGAMSGAGAYATSKFPFLSALRLTSGITESVGRRTAPLMQGAITDMEEVRGRLGRTMDNEASRVLQELSRKHGVTVTRFEPENAPNAAVAQDLSRIRAVMAVRRMGWDVDRTERVVKGVAPKEQYVRISHVDPTSGKRAIRTMVVAGEEFEDLYALHGKKVGLNQLSLAKHGDLLERMPGLRKGENLRESMERRGLSSVRFSLGLKGEKRVGDMDRSGATMDLSSIEQGGARVVFEDMARKKLVRDTAALESVEREFGLEGFQEAERKMYELGRVLLVGDEGAYASGGRFVVDNAKVLRLARGQLKSLEQAGVMTEGGQIVEGGEEAVRNLLSDEWSSRLIRSAEKRTGTRIKRGMTRGEIEGLVVEAYKQGFEDPHYMPRNTVEAYDKTGRPMQYNPYTGQPVKEDVKPSGRGMLRTRTKQVPWDPRDLEFVRDQFGGTRDLDKLIAAQRARVQGQMDEQGFYRVMRLAPDLAASKYVASTARDYAMFSKDVEADPHVQVILKDLGPGASLARLPGPLGRSGEGAPAGSRELGGVPAEMRPSGGYSRWDMLDTDLKAQVSANPQEKFAVDLWRRHIIPATLGIKPVEDAAHVAAATRVREGARRLADSKFMRAVERQGEIPARFVQQMRAWGNDSAGDSVMPWQSVTKLLYGSHMGLNMGTVLINLLQPIQSIHQLGFRNTVKAYGQSLQMIGTYLNERRKLGPGATPEQVAALQARSYTRAFGRDAVDISRLADIGSTWSSVEKAGYGSTPMVGNPRFSLLEMMMKPFQYSETLNRTVTANAVLNGYERAGLVGSNNLVRAEQDAFMAVQQFQFGSSPLSRPALFYLPGLRNPAFRQFAQYGLRSFTNLFTVPKMVDDTRRWGLLQDVAKMVAVSAVTYEIGKSMLGLDVSRGLAFGMTDIVGGQQALQGDQPPLYVPPVVDVGWNAIRYLGTGDADVMKDLLPRVVPGGVAISRALGVASPSETLQGLGLQRTYADWRQSQGGMVPVFNMDGRFMGQYPTSDVVLRAFGADMGRFGNPQELSQFLVKNRDAIREGRRQYIAAVLGNNMGAAKRVKAEFEKRFGMPLTVTQEQMKQAVKLREESVVSRTLETMDRDARDVYQQAVAQTLPGQLMAGGVPGQPEERGDVYRWGYR